MSVVFSGSFSGTFISTGAAQFIPLPSGVDWMEVHNETVSYAAGAGTGAEFYWRRGMPQGLGTIYTKTAITGALAVAQIAANSGFYLQDQTVNVPGPGVAITGITGANPPLVLTASTAGLIDGSSIVRIFRTVGALQLQGLDFTVGAIVPNTSFALAFAAAIAAANPGAGIYRIIPFNPYFYPSYRYITKISQAVNAIVTLSVTHDYTIGQVVRLQIPMVTALAFGMTELNGVQATIINIGQPDADGITNTITIDVDTTGFTAFAYPLTADPIHSPAMVIPMGENTADALLNPVFPALNGQNILGDATVNTAQLGMLLQAGTGSPAGVAGNVVSWVAGKSFNQ